MTRRSAFKFAIAISGILLVASPSYATTFDFSYSGLDVMGSGQFVGDLVSGDQYNLTSITGTANGETIVQLEPGTYGADNQLFYPSTPGSLITFAGISFSTVSNTIWNLFQWNVDGGPYFSLTSQTCSTGGVPDSTSCPYTPISFNVAAVPLPAGMPLLGASLALLGFLGLRKKRSGTALSAA